MREFGGVLGSSGADSDLVQASSTPDGLGGTTITYIQRYGDLPVYGGVVRARLDASNNLTAVNGTIVPDIEVDATPKLSASDAAQRAIETVAADPPDERHRRDRHRVGRHPARREVDTRGLPDSVSSAASRARTSWSTRSR